MTALNPEGAHLYYTIQQIADRWQVDTKTVRRIINRGELIATRIGGQFRIAAGDVLAYEKLNRGRR